MYLINRKNLRVVSIFCVLFFLTASSISALKADDNDFNKLDVSKNEVCLTNEKLFLLKFAKIFTDDLFLKEKLVDIIQIVERNGLITNEAVKEILGRNGGIYSGNIDFNCEYEGFVTAFPGLIFRSSVLPFWLFLSWGGSGSHVHGCYGFSNELYSSSHNGFSILGFGTWDALTYNDGGWYFDAEVNGFSPLIIIY